MSRIIIRFSRCRDIKPRGRFYGAVAYSLSLRRNITPACMVFLTEILRVNLNWYFNVDRAVYDITPPVIINEALTTRQYQARTYARSVRRVPGITVIREY